MLRLRGLLFRCSQVKICIYISSIRYLSILDMGYLLLCYILNIYVIHSCIIILNLMYNYSISKIEPCTGFLTFCRVERTRECPPILGHMEGLQVYLTVRIKLHEFQCKFRVAARVGSKLNGKDKREERHELQ